MIRTLSRKETDAFLYSQTFGHLGCAERGTPYVFPMAYAYDGQSVYGQTTEGKKLAIIRANPIVCFQVEERHPIGWTSVIVHGRFEELDFQELENGEAQRIIRLLTERLDTIQEEIGLEVPFLVEDGRIMPGTTNGKESTLFRIVVTDISGRAHARK